MSKQPSTPGEAPCAECDGPTSCMQIRWCTRYGRVVSSPPRATPRGAGVDRELLALEVEAEADRLERESVYSAQGITRDWLRSVAEGIRKISVPSEIAERPSAVYTSNESRLAHALREFIEASKRTEPKYGDCLALAEWTLNETSVSATRPICPFCNPAALYANPNNTRAEGPPAIFQTRKKCPTCPYFNGCMVGDCDYGT